MSARMTAGEAMVRSIHVLALALALLWGVVAAVPASAQIRAELVEYGIFRVQTLSVEKRPNGITMATVAEPTLVRQIDKFPAALGRSFGIRFRVTSDRPVLLRRVLVFPKPGLRAQKGRPPVPVLESLVLHEPGGLAYYGYSFDEPWEQVTGPWTFQLWDRDRLLLEKTIIITEGDGPPIS